MIKASPSARAHAHFPMAIIVVFAALFALGGCDRPQTILTVHASATTRSAPDLAIVTLGVVARGSSARDAQAAQSARMVRVIEAARAAGVEETEVQTVGFSLEPQYVYARGAPPRISGYISRNIVAIRLRNLGAVSGLIDTTVAEGANELQGIQFTYQNVEGSRDAARAQAVETARVRATAYAEAADMKLGRLLSITEPGAVASPFERAQDGYVGRQVSVEQAANAPINPGELENQSSVTVVFELR